MRALIVYEDSHRSYGEAMVGAVRASRPGLEEILEIIDETEELVRTGRGLRGC